MRRTGIGAILLGLLVWTGAALAQEATVEGTVRDALGRPIAGAEIAVKAENGKQVGTAKADSSGHFALSHLPAGNYSVAASQSDFETATVAVTVGRSGAAEADLVLKSKTALDMALTAKQLDQSRNQLLPDVGANAYNISDQDIQDMPQGEDTSFNHLLLQTPGAAQDSFGQIHLRGEHANLQYRINDVLLPEGITGFGQVLDTRIADNVEVIDGALPAQYGYRTTGVVDITTKSGAFDQGGVAEMYGGQRGTLEPSVEYGGNQGNLNYFLSGSYLTDQLGLENPISAANAIHDRTEQEKGFGYFSYVLSPFARVNLIMGSSIGQFQIPNNPGQPQAYPTPTGGSPIPSADLDESQIEISHYAIVAVQGTSEDGDVSYQLAPYTRYTSVHFDPDPFGDLEYNGIASDVLRTDTASGLQGDGSYLLDDRHTIRAGFVFQSEYAVIDTDNAVYPVVGGVTEPTPEDIVDNHAKLGNEYGVYIQDEWRVLPKVTINYGARFDVVNAYTDESQLSPRLSVEYRPYESTTFHAGYARYFTPPPMELVSPITVAKFTGTSAASTITEDDPVRAERAHVFDAGLEQDLPWGIKFGWDNYYKIARNLLDEGQFTASPVFTPFNYAQGLDFGSEATLSYVSKDKAVHAYLNFAADRAMGKDIDSSQGSFSSDPAELAFAETHWVYLDHDQLYTASSGVSYQVLKDTKVSLDGIMGSGLRSGFANEDHVPLYTQFDLGVVQHLDVIDEKGFDLLFSVVNLLDTPYEIRSGTGIGVFAPQYGPRRAFYAGLSRKF